MKKLLLDKCSLYVLYDFLFKRIEKSSLFFIYNNQSCKITNIKKDDLTEEVSLFRNENEEEHLVCKEIEEDDNSFTSSVYMEIDDLFSPLKTIFIYFLCNSEVSIIRMSFKMDNEEEEKAYQEFYSFIDRLKLESS